MNGSIASMLRALLLLGAGMLALGGLSPAGAAYPEKLIRIVVPYAPGGPNDIVARVLAQELGARWNQQVVVENRPGGGATIGGLAVAKAPALQWVNTRAPSFNKAAPKSPMARLMRTSSALISCASANNAAAICTCD